MKYIATNVPAGEDPVVEAGDVLYFSVYIQNKATLRYVVLNDMLYLSKLLYLRLHTLCITLYKRYPRLIYLRSNLPYKYIMSYYASIFYTTNILYFPIIIRNYIAETSSTLLIVLYSAILYFIIMSIIPYGMYAWSHI